MKKQNCWEHMKCGRQPGGSAAAASGICPVSVDTELNGVHGGENAGRACWTIEASLCPEIYRETAATKFSGCWKCGFFQSVKNEERSSPHGFIATYREMKHILLIKNCADRLVREQGEHPGGPADIERAKRERLKLVHTSTVPVADGGDGGQSV